MTSNPHPIRNDITTFPLTLLIIFYGMYNKKNNSFLHSITCCKILWHVIRANNVGNMLKIAILFHAIRTYLCPWFFMRVKLVKLIILGGETLLNVNITIW